MSMTAAVTQVQATRRGLQRVAGKFVLAIGVLGPAVLAVAGVSVLTTVRVHQELAHIVNDSVPDSQRVAKAAIALDEVKTAALQLTATYDVAGVQQLNRLLDDDLLPRAQNALVELDSVTGTEAGEVVLQRLRDGYQRYLALRRSGVYDATGAVAERASSQLARRTADLFAPIDRALDQMRIAAEAEAAEAKEAADRTYARGRLLLLGTLAVCLLLGAAAAVSLIRDMVPRIRAYSRYAREVAAGSAVSDLRVRGADELAELGHALNTLVTERRHDQRDEQAQAEFVDALQATEDEDEADLLLQRHLERSLSGAAAVVLKRNNSADRLQPSTPLSPDSDLTARLASARPRACLAVRGARSHQEDPGRIPLLSCSVCGERDAVTTCEPLLVGGEVIGSVLVCHATAPSSRDLVRIQQSVAQAAPVLANLRNLALAEFRANNDSLTGLPNKRATEDTLKRMIAHADRALTPLTAIMLDLDRFKQINDRHGHAHGDEVLAATGAALRSCLRTSDFAGRFGGEEFLILLPDTPLDAAHLVAEKIREAIAAITVPGIDRDITASLGAAALLDHGGTSTGLLRAADQALYTAKATGRNRTILATPDDSTLQTAPTENSNTSHATSPPARLSYTSLGSPPTDD